VPKNHAKPQDGTLKLFGRCVRKNARPIVPLSTSEPEKLEKLPYLVYLEGGPGFGNREPQNVSLTHVALERGYQVLYLDYRGTGLSSPVTADSVIAQGERTAQVEYLKLFRADSIVRDLEAVRLCLTKDLDEGARSWSIFGQSYGGFVALTYLSKYPEGLREAFLTGGLAPVKRTAEEVYRATYKKVIERNQAYYKKYPEDIANVRRLATYIFDHPHPIELPTGRSLTVGLFLSIGLAFGGHGGLDEVHSLVLRMVTDLDQVGYLTRPSLAAFEAQIAFDTHPIYAILHEAIYCRQAIGAAPSNWAAYRVGSALPHFSWLVDPKEALLATAHSEPLYFSGEMVFPFHVTDSPELNRIAGAADHLAQATEWGDDLYDEEELRHNEVPVYAVSYIDDMYVDFEFARETAALVRGIKVLETNGWYHDAVRSKAEDVLTALFKLRDDEID
jgi:pimeloyl-ACP methyl ester carboxylesterase